MSMTRPFQPATPAEVPAPAAPNGQILCIPLDNIRIVKLQRDRSRRLDPEIDDLKASILDLGLSNPIRVESIGAEQYELVQGWRRLTAFRALWQETKDPRFACIPATPMQDRAPIEALYRRMVDENMVRKDISWAEMARLALCYVDDPNIDCRDLDAAVGHLFASASPQKRSYIRKFVTLMMKLEKVLEYPEAIPRALGLDLVQALQADPGRTSALCAMLRNYPDRDCATEIEILRCFAGPDPAVAVDLSPRGNPVATAPQPRQPGNRPAKRGGALVRHDLMGGAVSCTITPGGIDLRMERDFTTLPRARLETAIAAFFAALGPGR